jgi:hypothetical protein
MLCPWAVRHLRREALRAGVLAHGPGRQARGAPDAQQRLAREVTAPDLVVAGPPARAALGPRRRLGRGARKGAVAAGGMAGGGRRWR